MILESLRCLMTLKRTAMATQNHTFSDRMRALAEIILASIWVATRDRQWKVGKALSTQRLQPVGQGAHEEELVRRIARSHVEPCEQLSRRDSVALPSAEAKRGGITTEFDGGHYTHHYH